MTSIVRVKSALMMIIMLVVISISSVLDAEASSEVTVEAAIQAQESDTSTDWFGVFCCLFIMLVTVGFPIAIIVFITKFIQGSGKKKQEDVTWKDQRSQERSMKTTRPVRIDLSHNRNRPPPIPDYSKKPIKTKKEVKDEMFELKKRKEPEVEKKIIEMDLTEREIEKEPEMPKFERPQALSDEEKDEFIVERIMELQGMLKDGEIDKKMYDQLKNRLMDQLED